LAERLGWGYWACSAAGIVLASMAIVTWLAFTTNR